MAEGDSLRPSVAALAARGCLALLFVHAAALAQDFPVKPIRLIVPFAPGGPTDLVARPYGLQLSAALGQQIVMDSRGGAGGIIGTEAVAKAAPDGYTLLLASFSFALQPIQYKSLPYDTIRDFAGVSQLANAPLILVINPSIPARSLKELIAFAKPKPGELNYSTTGPAASGNLAMLTLQSMSGIKFTPINYKGASLGSLAVVSGEVQLSFFSIPVAVPYVKSGKLRALGVSSEKRNSALAEVPTIAEAGLPGYEEVTWYGILAPSRTPAAIIAKLNRETVRVVQSAETHKAYTSLGLEPMSSTPEAFSRHIAQELEKWSRVLKDLKPE